MGLFISKIVETFSCNSSCSINHELHEDIDNVCFHDMMLSQKEIKSINYIIKKDEIKKKNSMYI